MENTWVKIKTGKTGNDEYFENYLINLNGEVKNIKTGRILKSGKLLGYYVYCIKINKNYKPRPYKRANLMAMTFLDYKPEKGLVIDHIDNDRTNDKLENLQIITHRENNTKERKPKKSGYNYVYPYGERWRVRINHKGRNIHYGIFDDINEAHMTAQNELKKLLEAEIESPYKNVFKVGDKWVVKIDNGNKNKIFKTEKEAIKMAKILTHFNPF